MNDVAEIKSLIKEIGGVASLDSIKRAYGRKHKIPVSIISMNQSTLIETLRGIDSSFVDIKDFVKLDEFVDPKILLEYLVSEYERNDEQLENDKKAFEELNTKYPKDGISKLSLEDYCIGRGDSKNYCGFIEKGLANQGLFFPGPKGAYVYGIFYNKDTNTYKTRLAMNGTPQEYLETVLKTIEQVLSNPHDIALLEGTKQLLDGGFVMKLLNSYYPNEFLQINSKAHLEKLVRLFSLGNPFDLSIFRLERIVFEYYSKIKKQAKVDLAPIEFMRIIYDNFSEQIKSKD